MMFVVEVVEVVVFVVLVSVFGVGCIAVVVVILVVVERLGRDHWKGFLSHGGCGFVGTGTVRGGSNLWGFAP